MAGKRKTTTSASRLLFDRVYRGRPERVAGLEETIEQLKVGQVIRQMREGAGLTQAQLAQRVGTTKSQISRIEDTEYDNHTLATLRRIADALGRSLVVRFERPRKQPARQRRVREAAVAAATAV